MIIMRQSRGGAMDWDIKDYLREVSRNVQDIGRKIDSMGIDVHGLMELSEALKLNAKAVKTYAKIQASRYEKS
jgi:hypothetical protein